MPPGHPPAACLLAGEVSLPQPLAELPQGRAGASAVPTQHCPWTPARCRRRRAAAEVNGAAPLQPSQRREPDTRSRAGSASPVSSQPAPSPTPPPPPGLPLLLFGERRAAAARDRVPLGKQTSPAPPRPSPRRGGGCRQTKPRRSGRVWRGNPRQPLPARLTSRGRAAPAASSKTAKWGNIAAVGSGEGGGKEGCRPARRDGVRL